ncbi:MAG: SDR family NAD(P)-dependent oxidoreductase [Acidimicrobiia bacterium]
MRFLGKTIVVTGASGIAAASARRLANEGARVFVLSRDPDQCEELVTNLEGDGHKWVAVDLTDQPATDAALKEVDVVHGLFGVAGGSGRRFGDGPFHELTTEAWQATTDLNDLPTVNAAVAVLNLMLASKTRGSIVLTSSVLATSPSPQLFATHAYAASKGGITALVRAAAAYYAPAGIRFNAIAPGLVDTPMADRAANDPAIRSYIAAKQPLMGDLLDPADIAAAAAFLLSDDACMITGQTIAVDGGWSVTET